MEKKNHSTISYTSKTFLHVILETWLTNIEFKPVPYLDCTYTKYITYIYKLYIIMLYNIM